MKKINSVIAHCFLGCFLNLVSFSPEIELKNMYDIKCKGPSDICEHVSVLRDVARKCASAVEIGLRDMNSSWGILKGLSENASKSRSYLGIDLAHPPMESFNHFKYLAESVGVKFSFIEANDMSVNFEETDMLFIDSSHTYCHLTYELEKFSPKVKKYIAMHDTGEPFGWIDEVSVNYSLYPAYYSKIKKGLWAAVLDFLAHHSEWKIKEHRSNCHGFTVLERIG